MSRKALESTDARIRAGKPVTPGFLFAALLWGPVLQDSEACAARGMSDAQACEAAGTDVIERQIHHVSLPRRFSQVVREIWGLQPRLVNRRGRGAAGRLLAHPRFRAAYDFLLLRAESGEDLAEHAQWWTRFQEAGEDAQRTMPEDRHGAEAPPPTSPGTRDSTPGIHRAAGGLSSPPFAVEDTRSANVAGSRPVGAAPAVPDGWPCVVRGTALRARLAGGRIRFRRIPRRSRCSTHDFHAPARWRGWPRRTFATSWSKARSEWGRPRSRNGLPRVWAGRRFSKGRRRIRSSRASTRTLE